MVKSNSDGTPRQIKSRKLATISDLNVKIDPANGDLEYLQEIQNGFEMPDIALTLVSGDVYSGSMQITDEIEYDTKEGTAGISLAGNLEIQG